MNRYPKIRLSILRQIGWDEWDPIGIRKFGTDDWQINAADEYDAYLLHVVNMLHSGESQAEAAAYLDGIAAQYMGLGARTPGEQDASAKTVGAIASYLRTLPDGPLGVRQ